LNELASPEHRRKNAKRVQLGAEHDRTLRAPGIVQKGRDVQRNAVREEQPHGGPGMFLINVHTAFRSPLAAVAFAIEV
jgi:hypothetical protein